MGVLKYYYGGHFVGDPFWRFVDAQIREVENVDPDLLDYFALVDMGKECVEYRKNKEIEGVMLHFPGTPYEQGLLKLHGDKEVIEVSKVLEKQGKADLYVVQKHTFSKVRGVDGEAHGENQKNSEILQESEILSQEVRPTSNKEVVVDAHNSISPEHPSTTKTTLQTQKTSNSQTKTRSLTPKKTPQKPKTRTTGQILELLQSQGSSQATLQSSPTTRSKAAQSLEAPQKKPLLRQKLPIRSRKKEAAEIPSQSKFPSNKSKSTSPKCNTPAETVLPSQIHEDYDDWVDNRPESPIPFDELVGVVSSDGSGSNYQPHEDSSSEDDSAHLVAKKTALKGKDPVEQSSKRVLDIVLYKEGPSNVTEGPSKATEVEAGDDDRSDDEDDDQCDDRSVTLSDTSDEEIIEAVGLLNDWEKRRRQEEENVKEQVLENLKRGNVARQANDDSDFDGSESDPDDLLAPIEDSDDECLGRKGRLRAPLVNKHTDFRKLKWVPGMRFPNKALFRDAVTRCALAQGRNLIVWKSDKNNNNLLVVKCKGECPFHLHASWDKKEQAYLVKSVKDIHSCTRDIMSNRQLKSKWVATEMLELFKVRPHIPAKEIVDCIKKSFNLVVKRGFAYKIKHVAHKMLHGSMHDHYAKVGSYIQALLEHNPSSMFLVDSVPSPSAGPPVFRRIFICFEGLKNGFLIGCRRVICLDGCFIKTFLGGMLLEAIGTDANNQMFPLCWAVVEGENTDSWEWFLVNLRQTLGGTNGVGWTLISDQQKGLLNAVGRIFPEAEHRNCARHIYNNWCKTYKGDELKSTFWDACSAYCNADFQKAMNDMKRLNPEAAVAFLAQNPKTFCRAFLNPSTKCDLVVNNLAESFNAAIVEARAKHVIYMLEDIRHQMMELLSTRREWMSKSLLEICPKIQKKLEKSKELAALCSVTPSSGSLYEVKYGLDDLVVNMDTKSCTCRRWDLSGIPCAHAAAAANFMRRTPESFIHPLLTKETYLITYNHSIGPCVGEKHWPESDLVLAPPEIKAMPGRPKKTRIKAAHEDPKNPGKLTRHGVIMHCSICKSSEHTKRKCPDKDNQPAPPAKRQKTTSKATTSKATTTKATTSRASTSKATTSKATTTKASTSRASTSKATTSKSKAKPKQTKQPPPIVVSEMTAVETRKGRGRPKGVRGRGRGRGRGPSTVPNGAGIYIDTSTGQSFLNSPGMSRPLELSSVSAVPDVVILTQASTTGAH